MKVERIHDAEDHLTQLGTENGTRVVPENTILFVVRGMILARHFPIAMTKRTVAFNQDLKAAEPADFIDNEFLFHWFRANTYQILGRADEAGHGTKRIQTDRLLAMPISVPPLPVQQRIAGILSAYDELMENSQRRIRILEAMARALYREWFVHFRFPGNEKLPRVASHLGDIPHGWEVKKLGDVAEDMRRNVPKGKLDEPKPYVGLEHIPRRSLALDAWKTATDLGSNKLAFKKGEVLFGKIRPYFHKVSVAPFDGVCSADTIVIRARRPEHYAFVVACVSSDAFVAEASATANGAKMPRANWDVLEKYQVVIPNGKLAATFSALFANIIGQQQALIFKIQNLRRTRDLLLPRLLSGLVQLSQPDAPANRIIPLWVDPAAKRAKKTTDEFVEAVLIAQLTRRLASPQFLLGRLRYNKLGYFAHRKAEDDVTELYLKKAAGPYSPWAKYQGPEKIALKNGYVKRVKAGALEGLTTGDNIDKIDRYLSHYPACAAIDWVVTMFRYRRNDDLELLATVDFAALDLLREGAMVTLETIKRIIASNKEWTPKLKRKIFSDENITRALTELRGLFPNTHAP